MQVMLWYIIENGVQGNPIMFYFKDRMDVSHV
jgi:hypothetical protein